MIPILYENNETSFSSNGIGRLPDCIRCIVTEERNGIYEVEFDYPVSGVRFEEITIGRIVACTHDEQGDVQPFDIYKKTEPINGVVTFYARHISYRLNGITVKPFTAGSCAAAIAALKTNSVGTNSFTFWTNKSVTADYVLATPHALRGLLGGEQNSLLDVYGTGEYEFDKFDVKLYLHRGQDTNVSIRYGKNLVDFNNDYDAGDIYTAVVPFWFGSETDSSGDTAVTTETIVVLPEWYISSGHAAPGGRDIIVPMDLSGDFQDKPTEAQLRSAATAKLSGSDAWLPAQTMTVDFVQLWQTEEYKDYAPLQRLKLCDTCGVFVPMFNISLRVKVIKVVYNVLLDRYDSMELGDKPTTYAAVIEKNYDSKVAGIIEGLQALSVDIGTVEANARSYTDAGLAALESTLETQIDGMVETWAQSTNPATAWTTAELRAQHNGDLWLYTGLSNLTVDGVTIVPQGVYQYNSTTSKWAAYSSTSNNLFDLVDGKTTIYYGTTSESYPNKVTGDYLVDSSTGKTYRWDGSSWLLQTDYASAISNAVTNVTNAYEQAIADATDLIRGGTGGYIVTTVNGNGQPIELLITDNIDITQAVNVWRWNLGGLAHSSTGYNGPFNDVAITQDGKINASMILTGALVANIITSGLLQDASGKNYWNLDSGQFVTKQGTIGSFAIDANSLYYLKSSNPKALTRIDKDGVVFTQNYYDSYPGLQGGYGTYGVRLNKQGVDILAKFPTSDIEELESVFRIYAWGAAASSRQKPAVSLTYPNAAEGMTIYPDQYWVVNGTFNIQDELNVFGDFYASGTKSRKVETDNYSERLLYCYETPTPLFGDIGEAIIGEDGLAYVDIDNIFSETIAERVEYQVFLQKEGEGDCWITDKDPRYFAIQGTPGLRVAWELKAKQKDYQNLRLEIYDNGLDEYDVVKDYKFEDYIKEQEGLLYG